MKRAATYVGALLIALIALVPLAWMVISSLKSNSEILQTRSLLPEAPTLENYTVLFDQHYFGLFLRNSIGITALSVACSLIVGVPAAFTIARHRLRWDLGRRLGLGLLTARIIPPIVIVVPIYLAVLELDLLNTWLALIIIYTAINTTFVVWLMESFFYEIPVDLEEAAMVDGDSRLSAFRRVVLPVAAPGLAATAILAGILTYNEFLFALATTSTPETMTVPRGAATLIGRTSTDVGAMAAAGVVGGLPIVLFALLVQRHLVRGLTLGAVK